MSFGFGFGFPSWRTLAGGFSPAALFVGGVQGAWYDPSDLSTMFDTSAGTTPVSMPGQGAAVPVGLMLDKSQGAQRFWSGYFDGAGDYLTAPSNAAFQYGTGNFTVEGWHYLTAAASSTKYLFDQRISGTGVIPALYISGGSYLYYVNTSPALTAGTVVANTWVHWAIVRNSGTTTLYINGSAVGSFADSNNYSPAAQFRIGSEWNASGLYDWQGYLSNVRAVKGVAVYTANFTPPSPVTGLTAISGTSLLTCQNSTFIDNSGNAFAITVNGNTTTSQNIPLGNHAISFNNTTARPELRARVNLLTYSEEFDNGAWTKESGGSISATNSAVAPDGTATADTWLQTASPGGTAIYQTSTVQSGATYTTSIYIRKIIGQYARFSVIAPGGAAFFAATFDLDNLTISNTGQGGSGWTYVASSITDAGNSWRRITITGTTGGTSAIPYFFVVDAATGGTRLANGSCYLWGADLRPANIGANVPAYQRIADALTYDTSGFPLYLFFTTDDSMYTPANLNLSGTDKVAVFAGVRKLSDAAIGILAELSASTANSGVFSAAAPITAGAGSYRFLSRGSTSTADATVNSGYAAPITNVFTGIGDISGDSQILRLNGIQAANSTADQGTGNFGTYPLFIGSRNNSSLWFNGHLYSLIIAGSSVSAGNISATEQWVAGKTGIQI